MVPLEEWFVVEGIHLGGTSRHVEKDDTFGSGWKMRRVGGQGIAFAGVCKETGESKASKSTGGILKELASAEIHGV